MIQIKRLAGVPLACAGLLIGSFTLAADRLGASNPSPSLVAPENSTHAADRAAMLVIERRHRQSMFDALSASDNPRERALAALIDWFPVDKTRGLQRSQLIARAADAAPDDALVQWMAVLLLDSGPDSAFADASEQALRRMQSLEPDNAAVWLQTLTSAANAGDIGGVDTALERMAASSVADEHYAGVMKALVDVYRGFPMPHRYFVLASRQTSREPVPPTTPQSMQFAMANALASAVALPAYADLVDACEIDETSGRHAWRAQDCAAVGRLFAAKGDTLISNRIGFALLRASHTWTGRDVANARTLDWLAYQESLAGWAAGAEAEDRNNARIVNWIVSGSELGSFRYDLAAHGVALTPPAGWVDSHSPFPAARLHEGANDAARRNSPSY